MMEDEEYPSDSDQSDDDYKPDDKDSDQPSEIDSDGEPENDADDESANAKPKDRKRKSFGAHNRSKAKRSKLNEEIVEEKPASTTEDNDNDDEDSKAHADALWADFLSGTDTGTTSTTNTAASSKSTQSVKPKEETATKATNVEKPATKQETAPIQKATVKEIFEFAGEKIEVEKEIQINDNNAGKKGMNEINAPAARARSSGGLSSVLGQLGKKNKLTVLEKTKLDWTGFKKNEGIDEELQVHNKGRGGYLERQDFLERTDVRRFEIEKTVRQATRRK